jgi:hypothetical protein
MLAGMFNFSPELSFVRPEHSFEFLIAHAHFWNYDKERGLYIDLSADQFPGIVDKVLISKVGDTRYESVHRPNISLDHILGYAKNAGVTL